MPSQGQCSQGGLGEKQDWRKSSSGSHAPWEGGKHRVGMAVWLGGVGQAGTGRWLSIGSAQAGAEAAWQCPWDVPIPGVDSPTGCQYYRL